MSPFEDEMYWEGTTLDDVDLSDWQDLPTIPDQTQAPLAPASGHANQKVIPGPGQVSQQRRALEETQPTLDNGNPSGSSKPFEALNLGKRRATDPLEDAPPAKRGSWISCLADYVKEDEGVPFVIASCPKINALMEERGICYGVKYELARLVSMGTIKVSDVTAERLDQLMGTNTEAANRVEAVFGLDSNDDVMEDKAFSAEIAARLPWPELDREETALSQDPYAGLGLNKKDTNWYGGKIEFCGKLQRSGKTYRIQLDHCALGSSCRFTRRFGSWTFIRVKVPKTVHMEGDHNLAVFFRKKFILWDYVFRACYAKNDNIFFFRTNETPDGGSIAGPMSFEDFISYHNPLEENGEQLMTKWSARMPLGFSTSIPGPVITQDCIRRLPDEVSNQTDQVVMTDGCGLTSRKAHIDLFHQLALESVPTAFQFRFAGFKGMSLINQEDTAQDTDIRAWFRPSQTKINYPIVNDLDPSQLVIDILRTSFLRSPARINPEIIVNLAENSVPKSVFVDLLRKSVEKVVADFKDWESEDAMFNLWINTEKAGGVLSARRAREGVGEARARGYRNKTAEDEELEDEEEEDDLEPSKGPKSTAWWWDHISGCPSSLQETVMVLLDSGFKPQECAILRAKLNQVVKQQIESRAKNLRFEIEQSLSAFVVPDPLGVLQPDEIHVKSSKRKLTMDDGTLADIVVGDVLIGRNPCKVPSDMRKVKATMHPKLSAYEDVIVCSVQGHRPLMDYLAGGDYDGDTAIVIWQPEIVSPFRTASDAYSLEPPGLAEAFTRDEETGSKFLARVKNLEPEQRIRAMQDYLLGALRDASLTGRYSAMHDSAIYEYGYGHEKTVLIAAKFCRVLDAPKTGYRIKPEVFRADRKLHNQRAPNWKEEMRKRQKTGFSKTDQQLDRSNLAPLKRIPKATFIMDKMISAARDERDKALSELEDIFTSSEIQPDPVLMQPWIDFENWACAGPPEFTKAKQKDMRTIQNHVLRVKNKHDEIIATKDLPHSRTQDMGRSASFSSLPIEIRQDKLRMLSKMMVSGPEFSELPTIPPDETYLARLKASFAYKLDAHQKEGKVGENWSRFPWNTCLRQLCLIKAASSGNFKAVTSSFYERFRVTKQ